MAVIGYWPIRGYAQPIRYLMKYAGQPFEEKLYHQKGPPDFDKSEWRNVKDKLNLDFPNLPYYLDEKEGVRLSQSKAILLYLARKHKLVATKEEDIQRQDVVFFESIDLHNSFFFLTYQPSFLEMREDYVAKDLPLKLKLFEDFLGDRKFFVGDKVNFADFNVYEAIYVHTVLAPDCLKDFPKLRAFMKRFEELKGVKEYIKSKEHLKEPICSRASYFSNGNDEEPEEKK
ncbi:glutathione S-transferase Mu 1-like isoform X2 [Liolophura sinensis]|uniref:glutathione S-transferase Mu 1-like isoform X2 n=1 Tax=Liolophura sinensis TaxID=3198878 RepID=UPI003158C512